MTAADVLECTTLQITALIVCTIVLILCIWPRPQGLKTCMQDKKKIEQKMRKEYPPLKTARELEWGFKIRYIVVSCNFMF